MFPRKISVIFSRLWNVWLSLTGVFFIITLWQLGYEALGPLILPQPLETGKRVLDLLSQSDSFTYVLITAERTFIGFLLASIVGTALGILAGWSKTLSMLAKPFITIALGIPPIAWIVLALLWFGGNDGTPIFTVFISTVPLIFAGALQGIWMRDLDLDEMSNSFHISKLTCFLQVQLPQMVSYLFPAWATAFGLSWKVVVMAELLSSSTGIGAGLAEARVNIDTTTTMAWISIIVALLLIIEGILLNPIKKHVEGWKHAE